MTVEPNGALGQAHLSIPSFLFPLLVAEMTHPRLQPANARDQDYYPLEVRPGPHAVGPWMLLASSCLGCHR